MCDTTSYDYMYIHVQYVYVSTLDEGEAMVCPEQTVLHWTGLEPVTAMLLGWCSTT